MPNISGPIAPPGVANEVSEQERALYKGFATHQIGNVGRPLPDVLWHYTNADGFLGILKDCMMLSTQVSCLNDSLERIYFGDLVLAAVKARAKQNTDPDLAILHKTAIEALSNTNIWNVGYFVTCFSEVADDLAQWRGYGSGEAGYAIGFDSKKLVEAANRQDALLIPMRYEEATHQFLVNEVVKNAELFFASGVAAGRTNIGEWAQNFLMAFSQASEAFTCTIKHPKFSAEMERRIAVYLSEKDRGNMVFRAKRTLIARHMPLDLAVGQDANRRLPIVQIYIGPGPGQKASRVAVFDLLAQKGYKDVTVELSTVPYRVV